MCGLQVLRMVDNQHYLYRMTVLVAIASLAPAVHHDVLCSSMLPVVINCSKDRVRCIAVPAEGCLVMMSETGRSQQGSSQKHAAKVRIGAPPAESCLCRSMPTSQVADMCVLQSQGHPVT